MKRFFFDISNSNRSLYDYQGREFAKLEDVRELATLIALDLECDSDDWTGFEIKVRNIEGSCVISIPIRQPDLIAA